MAQTQIVQQPGTQVRQRAAQRRVARVGPQLQGGRRRHRLAGEAFQAGQVVLPAGGHRVFGPQRQAGGGRQGDQRNRQYGFLHGAVCVMGRGSRCISVRFYLVRGGRPLATVLPFPETLSP